jgi:hypothetical protein
LAGAASGSDFSELLELSELSELSEELLFLVGVDEDDEALEA